jgi:membrane protein implicated in regulation of membrane protease activity
VHYLIKKGVRVVPTRPVRLGGLGLLMVLAVGLFVIALGPSLADQLSSVAAAVSAVVALWLTYRSYQQKPKDEEGDGNA